MGQQDTVRDHLSLGEGDTAFVVEDHMTRKRYFADCEQHGWGFVGDEVYPIYRRMYDPVTKEDVPGDYYFEGEALQGEELVEALGMMQSELTFEHIFGKQPDAVHARTKALAARLEGQGKA